MQSEYQCARQCSLCISKKKKFKGSVDILFFIPYPTNLALSFPSFILNDMHLDTRELRREICFLAIKIERLHKQCVSMAVVLVCTPELCVNFIRFYSLIVLSEIG